MKGADTLVLRPAGEADLPAVMEIMRTAFDPRYGEAWNAAQCAGMLNGLGAWLTLAEHDGRPAGFALARETAGEAELLLIAVEPGARGHGIGGALLAAVADACRSRGASRLFLEVRASNSAIALYRARGFEKVGERRGYYRGRDGDLFDAHSYSLSLAK